MRCSIEEYYRKLDRSLFIDNVNKNWADLDRPLPIGFGQTISQPSLVLAMTQQLNPQSHDRVLEIGTGSGYQTALLAAFAQEVFTVERIAELSSKARQRLDRMGFVNIQYKIGDGSLGWPEFEPYDKIMVTAAAAAIPDELIQQLGLGGRMIIPVGPPGMQELLLVKKSRQGQVTSRILEQVVFVELKGRYGWGTGD
ncbi:MAG: protein-L-isoaspartate(D-aspartate) O-methyltransferase [Saccharofermentanales bacterium]|nr:protein-L-isoaspartate(D-aspartate) O-methyltransferase [Clostridiaceae bacterium]